MWNKFWLWISIYALIKINSKETFKELYWWENSKKYIDEIVGPKNIKEVDDMEMKTRMIEMMLHEHKADLMTEEIMKFPNLKKSIREQDKRGLK